MATTRLRLRLCDEKITNPPQLNVIDSAEVCLQLCCYSDLHLHHKALQFNCLLKRSYCWYSLLKVWLLPGKIHSSLFITAIIQLNCHMCYFLALDYHLSQMCRHSLFKVANYLVRIDSMYHRCYFHFTVFNWSSKYTRVLLHHQLSLIWPVFWLICSWNRLNCSWVLREWLSVTNSDERKANFITWGI